MTTAPQPQLEVHLKHGYSSLQIAIHWTVAALVVANVLLGGGMARVWHGIREGAELDSLGPAYIHVMVGLSVLLLMVARVAARVRRPVRVAADSKHRLLATLGRANHVAFYAMLFVIPILGALAWFGNVGWAGQAHGITILLLYVLIALHVAGTIVHSIIGDGIIHRMVRSGAGT